MSDRDVREAFRAWQADPWDRGKYERVVSARRRIGLEAPVMSDPAAVTAVLEAWPNRRPGTKKWWRITYEQAGEVIRAYYEALGWKPKLYVGLEDEEPDPGFYAPEPSHPWRFLPTGFPEERDPNWAPIPYGSLVSPSFDEYVSVWHGRHRRVSLHHWDGRGWPTTWIRDKKELARELMEQALRARDPFLPNPIKGHVLKSSRNCWEDEVEENPSPDERIRNLERMLAVGNEEAWAPLATELLRVDRNLLLEDVLEEIERRSAGRTISDPRIERIAVSSPEYHMGLAPLESWHVYFLWTAMEQYGENGPVLRRVQDPGNSPEWHVYADWRLMEALVLDAARRLRYHVSFSGLSDEGADRLGMVGTEAERRALVSKEPGRMVYLVDRPPERRRRRNP